MTITSANIEKAFSVLSRLSNRLKMIVLGRDHVIDLLLVALLADGHVLLEDYPGSGKTTLAKTLGDSIIDDVEDDEIPSFRRIQFTPDLLPSDVTGVTVFDSTSNTFHFKRGPIFAYLVLADEINRTSPKVQSAMLEAMAEKQVTVDNLSYHLDSVFFVIATQNPLDLAGTYPLPVAQLDRFLFKVRMDYIPREDEIRVLTTYKERRLGPGENMPRVLRGELVEARKIIEDGIYISPEINTCLVDIARTIRSNPGVAQGVSTRSLVLMLPALQVAALMKNRDYVTAEDVALLAPYVFGHRMELLPGEDDSMSIVKECMKGPIEILARKTLKQL